MGASFRSPVQEIEEHNSQIVRIGEEQEKAKEAEEPSASQASPSPDLNETACLATVGWVEACRQPEAFWSV